MAYPQMEPLGGFMAGMFQGQQAKDAEAEARLKQQQDLQTMLFAQQKQPLELQKFTDDSAHTRALTGQAAETTKATGLANKMAEETYDSRRQAFIDEAAAKHSLAEIEARNNKNEMDLLSDDPKVVEAARKRWGNSSAILKRKMELASAERSASNVATIGANAQRDVAKTRAAGGGNGNKLDSPKKLYAHYFTLAQTTEDPAQAARYAALADDTWKKVVEEINAKRPLYTADANGNLIKDPSVGTTTPVEVRPKPGASGASAASDTPKSTYTPGSIHTDSKGIKRKFIGGDEKDIKNWPEVK